MAVAVGAEQQADAFVGAEHKLLIDGEWVPAASGQTFATINPATEETLSEVAHGDAEDIARAVRAARRPFADDAPWRRLNASDRGRMIWKISELIEEHADELAMLRTLENGDYHAYTLREPVGVVGQIIPWTFPLLMAAWKLGPVLACGCTVVLKPVEQTPLSALRLGELMPEAGLPDGVVNIVTGFGDAGAALAAHQDVDKVAFTGSTEVGKLIVEAAARNLKKVTLELGGKSPNVVYPDADLESAIPGAAHAIFFNHGQSCNAGSQLYVHRDIYDGVVSGVADIAKSIKVTKGTDEDAQMGRQAVREGARLPRLGSRPGRAGRGRWRPPRRPAGTSCSRRSSPIPRTT